MVETKLGIAQKWQQWYSSLGERYRPLFSPPTKVSLASWDPSRPRALSHQGLFALVSRLALALWPSISPGLGDSQSLSSQREQSTY